MRKEEKSERILLWLDKWVFFVVVVVVPFFAMPCHGVRFNYTCLSHRSSKKKRKLAPSSPGHRARWRWEKVRLCLCVLYNNNNSCVFPLPSSCVYVCVIKLVSFSFAVCYSPALKLSHTWEESVVSFCGYCVRLESSEPLLQLQEE